MYEAERLSAIYMFPLLKCLHPHKNIYIYIYLCKYVIHNFGAFCFHPPLSTAEGGRLR